MNPGEAAELNELSSEVFESMRRRMKGLKGTEERVGHEIGKVEDIFEAFKAARGNLHAVLERVAAVKQMQDNHGGAVVDEQELPVVTSGEGEKDATILKLESKYEFLREMLNQRDKAIQNLLQQLTLVKTQKEKLAKAVPMENTGASGVPCSPSGLGPLQGVIQAPPHPISNPSLCHPGASHLCYRMVPRGNYAAHGW